MKGCVVFLVYFSIFPFFLLAFNPFFMKRHLMQQPRARQDESVPAVIKVVNVISDIGHGAQKVARKAAQDAEPLIRGSASAWRKTVDDHIVPGVKMGMDFMGEKAVESVDMIAEAVMGTEAKSETAKALKTLQTAIMEEPDSNLQVHLGSL